MENLKLVQVTKELEKNNIPLVMLKNRNIDASKTADEIFGEIKSDYEQIELFINTAKQKDSIEAMQSINDWGEARKK